MKVISAKCKVCGARLCFIDSPDNLGKPIRCSICGKVYRISNIPAVSPAVVDDNDKTQIGVGGSAGDMTELPGRKDRVESGYLKDSNMLEYPLKDGLNLVGRKTYKSPSVADIAIETTDRGFSRKHLFIEVSTGADGSVCFFAFNAENKNPTTINGIPIVSGDKVFLHDGDTIKSSETVLVFKTR